MFWKIFQSLFKGYIPTICVKKIFNGQKHKPLVLIKKKKQHHVPNLKQKIIYNTIFS